MPNARYYYGGPVVVEKTYEDIEIIDSIHSPLEFIGFIGFIIVFFIIFSKLVTSVIDIIEDIYTITFVTKCFYQNTVIPDLKIREEWCGKSWIVEWIGHQRIQVYSERYGWTMDLHKHRYM